MNNPLSYSSIKLDLFSKEGVRLKSASGFIVEAGNQYFLVTNMHILSGRDMPANKKPGPAIEPYTLKTSVHIYEATGVKLGSISMGMRKRINVPLYDENDAPRWIESRADKERQFPVDIAALPIQLNLTLRLFSGKLPGININKGPWAGNEDYRTKISAIPLPAIDTDVEYGPPDAVHVIGYPLSWAPEGSDRSSSAFWRTSFIASEMREPGMNRSDSFFIDPCPAEGMAGSPVVGMKNDRLKLLGVYSDHSTTEFGADAGLVWDALLLKELIGASE
jgi:hypothetical protein